MRSAYIFFARLCARCSAEEDDVERERGIENTSFNNRDEQYVDPDATPNEPPIKNVIALYNFSAENNYELSVRESEHLDVLSRRDDGWAYVRRINGEKGFVPSTFLTEEGGLGQYPWYSASTSVIEAERILMYERSEHGSFIVRPSRSNDAEIPYSIALLLTDGDHHRVTHYRIYLRQGKYQLFQTNQFDTMEELISFYASHHSPQIKCQLQIPEFHVNPQIEYLGYDVWEISRQSLVIQNLLGSGSFGKVSKALWNGNRHVAVKELYSDVTTSSNDFVEEANRMKTLRHPKILSLLAIVTSEPFLIVTEYMCNGTLLNYVKTNINIGKPELVYAVLQIAEGMEYLHGKDFVHRDLRAENVLVGEAMICKIADFGLTRFVEEGVYESSGSLFPIKWAAPEAFNGNFSLKSDVWSFGILLHEIFTKEEPYKGMTNAECADQVTKGYHMPKHERHPDEFYSILIKCWDLVPTRRPTFTELKNQIHESFCVQPME